MSESLNALNDKYGIPGVVSFSSGPGGLTVAEISAVQADAKVTLHGAHVLSFIPKGGRDILWLSGKSWYEPGNPIRGGIPVCWPWFGAAAWDAELPSHGFARITEWAVVETGKMDNGGAFIILQLTDCECTRKLWDYAFKTQLKVEVSSELRVSLIIENTGDKEFCFSAALHSYFAVSNVAAITVSGLDGTRYIDTLVNEVKTQSGLITFAAEYDNVFLDTDTTCVIDDPGFDRKISVAKEGSRSTVVWNPWIAKAARMPDYGDDEYPGMLCIETANAKDDARAVKPGETHTLTTIIS